jgi:geranylgeranylglycerol-phosphate geranylgeranyltransferase
MATYKPTQLAFWRYYLIQMRPYLLFISAAAGMMGVVAAMAVQPAAPLRLLWLAFPPFLLAYGFGQALTDYFQTDTDRLSAPDRPLSKGLLEVRHVLIVSSLGLAGCAMILVWLNPWNLLPALLTVGGLATYTTVKRRYWWGGPLYNAWIVSLLPVMGFLTVAPDLRGLPVGWVLMTFVAYANFVLMGYLKDIDADAATGYRTFPVVFGWELTVSVGHLLAVLALSILISEVMNTGRPVTVAWSLAAGAALNGQRSAARATPSAEGSIFAIECTVRTFILLQLTAMLICRPGWWIAAFVFYSLFERTLKVRYEQGQV